MPVCFIISNPLHTNTHTHTHTTPEHHTFVIIIIDYYYFSTKCFGRSFDSHQVEATSA